MSIITIKGFTVYDQLKGRFIVVDSDCIEECMEFYSKNNFYGVWISVRHGYKLNNVNFLSKYPDIKNLMISEGVDDIDGIYNLRKLEYFLISDKNRKIDFSHFPQLKKLIADWSPYFININECMSLQSLTFYKFSPKNHDCSNLPNVPWIKHLKLTQATIITFKGLEKFTNLEEIEINYCGKLETLCCLNGSKETLVSLLFDHCKKIKNHDYVMLFSNLYTLAFNDGGTIPSIRFIENIRSLKSFRFVGTDVTDGDMTPCIGFDYCAFTNKRHFSHTMEQINALSTPM